MNLGTFMIDEYVPLPAATQQAIDGGLVAPSAITYTVYEAGSAIVGPTAMDAVSAKTGIYLTRLQLTAAAGFETDKDYAVLIEATIDGATDAVWHTFQVRASEYHNPQFGGRLKKSTSNTVIVHLDGADYTPTVTQSKNGASFAAAAGTCTHLTGNLYTLSLTSDDCSTIGKLFVRLVDTGLDKLIVFDVVQVSSVNGLQQVDLKSWDGNNVAFSGYPKVGVFALGDTETTTPAAIATALDIDDIKAKTDLIPADPAESGDCVTASAVADAVLDEAMSDHVSAGTLGKYMQDIKAFLCNVKTVTTTTGAIEVYADDGETLLFTLTPSEDSGVITWGVT